MVSHGLPLITVRKQWRIQHVIHLQLFDGISYAISGAANPSGGFGAAIELIIPRLSPEPLRLSPEPRL